MGCHTVVIVFTYLYGGGFTVACVSSYDNYSVMMVRHIIRACFEYDADIDVACKFLHTGMMAASRMRVCVDKHVSPHA